MDLKYIFAAQAAWLYAETSLPPGAPTTLNHFENGGLKR